ncbi:hypothetical protein A2cp1_0029 [Anaeromyxobacter dehalogenans 2CP-1]|uniref:Uncharacterized protein n=1 Tax=Anaeromyxobacter dehalogenans (strain ATCC BAA-258 / DSM 21875 / 2CP-1) TaxID=455488 RepID=B8J7P8_ANAD2|nr:hypothetical protein [Anaeromyxobacter dehalogenans]ACL63390.1 hypothetical protein A2cp1_0029 [Anaeromyxobacter dehalogenans 2CP-1]
MSTVVTPVGTFKRVSSQDLKFAVVYVPEDRRRAGQDGFCHGWAVAVERAQVLADEVRAKFEAEPLVVAVTCRRRRTERVQRTDEE